MDGLAVAPGSSPVRLLATFIRRALVNFLASINKNFSISLANYHQSASVI